MASVFIGVPLRGLYTTTFSYLLFFELLLRLAPGQHYLTHERIRKQYDGGRIVVSASLSLRGERDAKKKKDGQPHKPALK